jgi:hypothetical protein
MTELDAMDDAFLRGVNASFIWANSNVLPSYPVVVEMYRYVQSHPCAGTVCGGRVAGHSGVKAQDINQGRAQSWSKGILHAKATSDQQNNDNETSEARKICMYLMYMFFASSMSRSKAKIKSTKDSRIRSRLEF